MEAHTVVCYIYQVDRKLHLYDDVRYFVHSFVREIGSCPIQDVEAIMRMIEPLVDYMVCVHMAA